MTISTTNISASSVSSEADFASTNRPFKFSEHFVNVIEQDAPAKMSMANLKNKKVSYNIDVWGYRYDWPYNSTPLVKIPDFFPYMTDDDWFSVDVAFTESQIISNQVFRVFFKYSSNGLNDVPFYANAFRPINSSITVGTTKGPNFWKRGEQVSAPVKRIEKIGGIVGYTTGMEYESVLPTDFSGYAVNEEFYSISDGIQIIFPTTYKEKSILSWQVFGGKPGDTITAMFYEPAAAFFASNSNKKVLTSSSIKLDADGYASFDNDRASWYFKAGMEVAVVFYYGGFNRTAASFKVVSSTDNQAINVYNPLKLQKYIVRQDYVYNSVDALPDPTKLQINQGSSPSLRILYPEFIKKGAAKFTWYVSGGVPNEEFYVTEKNSGKRFPATGNWTLDDNGNYFDTNGYIAPDDPWGGPVSFSFIFTKSGTVIKNSFILDSNVGQNGSFNNDNMQYIVAENGLYYKYSVSEGGLVYAPLANQVLRKSWKKLISDLTTPPGGLKIVSDLPDPNKYKANDGITLEKVTQEPPTTWIESVPRYERGDGSATDADGNAVMVIVGYDSVTRSTPGGITRKYDAYVLIESPETSTVPINEPNDRYEDIENKGEFKTNGYFGCQWYGWWGNGSTNLQTDKNVTCGVFYNPVTKDIFAGAAYQGIDTPDKNTRVRLTKITYWPKGVATKDQEYPLYTNDAGAGYYTGINPAIIRGWQENFYIEPTKDNSTFWQAKLDSKEYTVDRMLDFFAKYPAGNDAMWNTRMFSTQQKLRVKMAKLYTTYIANAKNNNPSIVKSYVNNYNDIKWCDIVNPLNSAQKGPPNLFNDKVTVSQAEKDAWKCTIATTTPITNTSDDIYVWVEVPGWDGDAEAYGTIVSEAMKKNPALAHDVAANKRYLNEDTDPPSITKWSLGSWYLGAIDTSPNLPVYIHGQPWFKRKYGIDATNPANRGKFYCDFGAYKGFYDLYKEGDVINIQGRVSDNFGGEGSYRTEAFFKLYKAPKLVLLNEIEMIPSQGFDIFNSFQFFSNRKDHFTSWILLDYNYSANPYASYTYNSNIKDNSFRRVVYGRPPQSNLKFGFDDGFAPQGTTDVGDWLNIGDVFYAYDHWIDENGDIPPNYNVYTTIPNDRPVRVYFRKYQLQWAGSQAEQDLTK